MPKDYAPPKTRVDDADKGERPHDEIIKANLLDGVYKPEYPDKKVVDNVIKLISNGKIENKDELSAAALDAYKQNRTTEFQNAINRKLEQMKSPYRLRIDDSMAAVQDIGSLNIQLINRDARKIADNCTASIDNSPKVPSPHIHRSPFEQQRQQELPSDWPRLDIFEPPTRRK